MILTDKAKQELLIARTELRRIINVEMYLFAQSELLRSAGSVCESLRIQRTSKDPDVVVYMQVRKAAQEAGEHYRSLLRRYLGVLHG